MISFSPHARARSQWRVSEKFLMENAAPAVGRYSAIE